MTKEERIAKTREIFDAAGRVLVFATSGYGPYWTDSTNVAATCAVCGARGKERAHNLEGETKDCPRVCSDCAFAAMTEGDNIAATQKTMLEVMSHFAKN